jgi:uncharacterized protein
MSLIPTPTAMVTGATGALGTAFCVRLITQGYTVVATGQNDIKLAELAHQLPRLRTVVCDLTDTDDLERLFMVVPQVDCLVAGAGSAEYAAFEKRDWQSIHHEISLNAMAVAKLVHYYGAGMVQRGKGQILTVASTAAARPSPYLASYAASKAFVITLSRALAVEWQHTGVAVCCCIPGSIRSEFAQKAGMGVRSGGLDSYNVVDSVLGVSRFKRGVIFPSFNCRLRWTMYSLIPDRVLAYALYFVSAVR